MREALDILRITTPLYVAMPETAYLAIFQHILGQRIVQQYALQIMIYNPSQEDIVAWIPKI